MESSFCGADKGAAKDQHFQPEHLMSSGHKLLQALLIYCKIDVDKKISELKKLPELKDQPQEPIIVFERPTMKLAEIE
jgi:hypothetical protein